MAAILDMLRKFKPAVVVAYDQDDEAIKINVPDVRKKHERVLNALEDIQWVRVDMLDKKGGHLHRHMRTVDDTQPTELDDLVRGAHGQVAVQLAPLVQIMLRAQEVAIVRTQAGQAQLLDAALRMVDMVTRRVEVTQAQLDAALGRVHELHGELLQLDAAAMVAAAAPSDDGRPASDKVLEGLMPAFAQAALGLPSAPAAAAANGAAKNGARAKEHRSPSPSESRDQGTAR